MKSDDLPFEQNLSAEPDKSSEPYTTAPSLKGGSQSTETQPPTASSHSLQSWKSRRLLRPPLILALALTGAVLGLLAVESSRSGDIGRVGNVSNVGGVGDSLDVPNAGFEDGLSGWVEGFAGRDEVKPNSGYVVGIVTDTAREGKTSAFIQVDEQGSVATTLTRPNSDVLIGEEGCGLSCQTKCCGYEPDLAHDVPSGCPLYLSFT